VEDVTFGYFIEMVAISTISVGRMNNVIDLSNYFIPLTENTMRNEEGSGLGGSEVLGQFDECPTSVADVIDNEDVFVVNITAQRQASDLTRRRISDLVCEHDIGNP
jgi:hypothetical protein